jgi:hypothetical protein
MKFSAFALVFGLLGFPQYASADMDSYAKDYVAKAINNGRPAFFSTCKEIDGSAILLFTSNEENGLLIELRDAAVVNLATINLLGSRIRVVETGGGVYSYGRIQALASDMANSQFSLLTPDRSNKVWTLSPTRKCKQVLK